jgi:hypothetical protein
MLREVFLSSDWTHPVSEWRGFCCNLVKHHGVSMHSITLQSMQVQADITLMCAIKPLLTLHHLQEVDISFLLLLELSLTPDDILLLESAYVKEA